MNQERASIFDDDALDLSEFTPAPRERAPRPKPDRKAIREAAEQRGFSSREPEAPAPTVAATTVAPRQPRRRLTGRNKQLNLKATDATIDRFYALADAGGWGLAETLEKAVEALEKQRRSKG